MKKSFLFSFGLIAAFALLFVSCDEASPEMGTSVCNVSLSVNGDGEAYFENYYASSITVEYGTEVAAFAYPYDGNYFVGWYEDGIQVSTDLNYVFTVYGNRNLVAKFEERTYLNNYEYVDLGLPSGLKWAAHNVGATKPEEYGGYYAWGETEEKEDYSWGTYKWCNGSYDTLTKYCTNSGYGTVDNKTVLDPEDDVAHVKWGGDWRMPTDAEQDELRNSCSWEWTALNGVNGYKVTGPNGNSIFLPAAGYRFSSDVDNRGHDGNYWSSSLYSYRSYYACYLYFYYNYYEWDNYSRYYGHSVRPVCGAPVAPVVNYTVSVLNNENGTVLIDGANVASALVADGTEVTVTATANDGYDFVGWFIGDSNEPVSTDATYTFVVEENVALVAKFENVADAPTFINGYEYVDLGLPSGLKWAAYNVGATKPEEYGGYYAWGETEEKESYYEENYLYYNYGSYTNIGSDISGTQYDVASVKWGGGWRMPTQEEQFELISNCSWEWTALNGVNGYKVTGPNGNSIFRPAAGYRFGTDVYDRGNYGYCWPSSLSSNISNYSSFAYVLYFYDGYYDWDIYYRYRGLSVRPVCGAPVVNYTVSVLNNENGTVLIDGANVASALVADGTEVTVIATANDGYEFVGWFIGDNATAVSTDATYTFAVGEDIELVAKFNEKQNVASYEAVDLGLSVKWASFNVGATKPEEYGGYYAWGETEEKEDYSWGTYKWCNGSYYTLTKYCTDSYGTVDNKTVLDLEDDVAHVKWGGDWRMPTKEEQDELRNNCTWEWTTLNGVNGYMVTGPNGNCIFLPAAGNRGGTDVNYRGYLGNYWSGSLLSYRSSGASFLYFYDEDYSWNGNDRSLGLSVRPVSE